MPRKYVKPPGSRTYQNYSVQQLDEALDKIRTGELSQRAAEQQYKIPRATLKRKLKGEHSMKPGGQTALSYDTERIIVEHILALSKYGFPMDEIDVRHTVKNYLDKAGIVVKTFSNNLPQEGWLKGYLSRHQVLTMRFAQNIKVPRAAVSETVVNNFFDNIEDELTGIPACNIWNYDESNLTDDPGKRKVVTKRGCKYPENILNTSKSSTSIMFCGNAEGEVMPPYVVFKSDRLWSTWVEGGPLGTRYNRTPSGWFDASCFEDWFKTIVLPRLKNQAGYSVLVGDNLSSHINEYVVKACQQHQIKFICLPPNSTHLMQPLDVAYFRPMKMLWRKLLAGYKVKTNVSPIPKQDFPKLLKQLMQQLHQTGAAALKNGFRKTGLVPLNRQEVLARIPGSQQSTQSGDTSTSSSTASVVSETILDFLKKKRFGEGIAKPKRKKKLNVEPGKSISYSDLITGTADSIGASTAGAAKEQKKKKRREKVCNDLSSDSESDSNVVYQESDDESLMDMVRRETESQNEDTAMLAVEGAVEVGSWVLVRFAGKSSVKHFIGQVIPNANQLLDSTQLQADFDECVVKFLKKNGNVFVWPATDDISIIQENDIVKILPIPEMGRRGEIDFKLKFEGYNV